MSSPLKFSPKLEKFKRGQKEFTLILPKAAFTNNRGIPLVQNQQVLPYLNEDVKNVLRALKKADGNDYRGDFSYDLHPSLEGPPKVKEGKLELNFRLDRNTAASGGLRNLDNADLPRMGVWIPWTGANRSVDTANYLGAINLPLNPEEFQDLFCMISGFRQFSRPQ